MWRAVFARSSCELAACAELKRLGVRAFSPFETITQHRTVRRLTGLTRVVTFDRPIFSRYLFAFCDEIRKLLEVQGVLGVICGAGGEPLAISERDRRFAELLDLAGQGEPLSKLDLTRLSMGFQGKLGDLFAFVNSPFEGYQGKITSLDRLDVTGEVEVEFEIFGGVRTIAVSHLSVGHIVGEDGPRVAVAAAR